MYVYVYTFSADKGIVAFVRTYVLAYMPPFWNDTTRWRGRIACPLKAFSTFIVALENRAKAI